MNRLTPAEAIAELESGEPIRLRTESWGEGDRALFIGDKEVGSMRKREQTYNLRRFLIVRWWEIRLHGQASIKSGELFRDAVTDACRAVGAEAWGEGKNPRKWHVVELRPGSGR